MGSIYPKKEVYERKICRGVMCHEHENDAKFKKELTRQFKIDIANLTSSDPSTQKY